MTMLGKVGLFLPFVCLALLSASLVRAQDPTSLENSNESSENFTSKVTETENEDDVEVFDGEGNLVTTVFYFRDDGVEIERPEDREVCLVKETQDNGTCFEERPVNNLLPEGIWEKCTGREVVFLKQMDCDHTPETGSEISDGGRAKRGTTTRCCLWTYTTSTYCGATNCCKRNFWGRCTRHCCTYYNTRKTWTYKCNSGFTSKS